MNNEPISLIAENISFGYKDKTTIKNINLEIPIGKISALIGPNGSGKSTLLKILCGLIKPQEGTVKLNGQQLNKYKPKNLA